MDTPQQNTPGSVRFEQARVRLARLFQLEIENVPDAEVQKYLERAKPAKPCGWPADVNLDE